jgi:hypothetical protein
VLAYEKAVKSDERSQSESVRVVRTYEKAVKSDELCVAKLICKGCEDLRESCGI